MAQAGVRVKPQSLRSFEQGCEQAIHDTDEMVATVVQKAGEMIRVGAAARTFPKSARTAAGYQSLAIGNRAIVFQRIPKTTAAHGEWGSWQMRKALLPSLWSNLRRINKEMKQGLDKVANRFERRR